MDLTPLPAARATLYALSHRKPNIAIVGLNDRNAEAFDVYRIDLRTGARELVLQNDQKYVGYMFDDDLSLRLASQMAADGSMSWFKQDLKTKAWQPYDQPPADMTSSFIGFDKSGKNLYASDSRGRNTAALVRVDFARKKSTVLLEDARVDLDQVLTHPTEHSVQAVQVNYDTSIAATSSGASRCMTTCWTPCAGRSSSASRNKTRSASWAGATAATLPSQA